LGRKPNSLFPEIDENTHDDSWSDVEIPHDWLVWGKRDVYKPQDGWYKKEFTLTEEELEEFSENLESSPNLKSLKDLKKLKDSKESENSNANNVNNTGKKKDYKKSVLLTFDGVNDECSIYVNQTLVVDECGDGCLGFSVEIGRFVKPGVNTIHVRVKHSSKSRHYTGAGIYRNIWLTVQGQTHILSDVIDGKGIRTDIQINADTEWKVRAGVLHTGEIDAIRYTLYAPQTHGFNGEELAVAESSGDYIFELAPEKALAWSLGTSVSPSTIEKTQPIYTIKAQLIKKDKIIDEASDAFVFRRVIVDDYITDGMITLNGRRVRICGVQIGDNYGALGAAFNENAARHQLCQLQLIGVNAISAIDGCLAPEMYKLCDELGILIINESDGGGYSSIYGQSVRHSDIAGKNGNSPLSFISYETLFDSAGNPKVAYYYYKAIWQQGEDPENNSPELFNQEELSHGKPYVKIFPHWDWNVGQIIEINVYSNMKKTELFLEGNSLGRRIIDWSEVGENGEQVQCATWNIEYECGELVARAYDRDGGIAAMDRVTTFWDATTLKTTCVGLGEDTPMLANGKDLRYISICAYDESGEFVANANNRISLEVSGMARLVGVDNGEPFDYDDFKSDNRWLAGGRLTAIIQSTVEAGEAGHAYVEVSSRGLKEAVLQFEVLPVNEDELIGVSTTETEAVYNDSYSNTFREEIPTRKVELKADITCLTANSPIAKVKAEIFPSNSDYTDIDWICTLVDTDDDGNEIEYEDIAHLLEIDGNGMWCQVTAKGFIEKKEEKLSAEEAKKLEKFEKLKKLREKQQAQSPKNPEMLKFRICAINKGGAGSQIISEIEMVREEV